jgi:hypothetical protein
MVGEYFRGGRLVDPLVRGVTDHAHDLEPGIVSVGSNSNPGSDGVAPGKQ